MVKLTRFHSSINQSVDISLGNLVGKCARTVMAFRSCLHLHTGQQRRKTVGSNLYQCNQHHHRSAWPMIKTRFSKTNCFIPREEFSSFLCDPVTPSTSDHAPQYCDWEGGATPTLEIYLTVTDCKSPTLMKISGLIKRRKSRVWPSAWDLSHERI